MSAARRACRAALALLLAAAPVQAQSFAPATGAGPAAGALALLDRALGEPAGAFALEAAHTRWFALPELQTRALALAAARRSVAVAAGLAQTGEPEYGWTSAALALGSSGAAGGCALRAEARHERRDGALAHAALARTASLEAGAGGWLALGGAWRAWASAPQLTWHGAPPPLVRPLQLGVRAESGAAACWAAVEAPRAGADGARLVGVSLGAGAFTVWSEARDGPWRASLGLAAARGPLGVAVRVDAHPDLPETTRLALTFGRPRGARP